MQSLLTIDLTAGYTGSYTVPPAWEADYIGGASLAARLLYDQLEASRASFSPGSVTFPYRATYRHCRASCWPFCSMCSLTCHQVVGGVELWWFLGARIAQGRL